MDSDPYCRNAPKADVNSTDWCILARVSPIYKRDDAYSGVDDIGEDAQGLQRVLSAKAVKGFNQQI
jgi:hypothetical protein